MVADPISTPRSVLGGHKNERAGEENEDFFESLFSGLKIDIADIFDDLFGGNKK